MLASLRRRLPRLGRIPRLCVVGICLLLAAQSAATEAAGRQPSSSARLATVAVARRALAAGHVLAADDLAVARWPATLRPPGARAAPSALVGRRLSAPLATGEPVTATRLLGPDLATGLGPGSVAIAVPVADEHVVDLIRPGDAVDLLAAVRSEDPAPTEDPAVATVARAARVLAVFRADAGDGGAELVLAVPRAVAASITREVPSHVFTAVLGPP